MKKPPEKRQITCPLFQNCSRSDCIKGPSRNKITLLTNRVQLTASAVNRRTVSALEHPVSSPPTLRAHPPRRYQEGRLPFPASPRGHYGMRKPRLDPRRSASFVFSRRENTPYKSGLTPVRAPTIWTIFQTESPPSHVTQPNDFLWLCCQPTSSSLFLLSHDCDCC